MEGLELEQFTQIEPWSNDPPTRLKRAVAGEA
jgi:hypothetical protein